MTPGAAAGAQLSQKAATRGTRELLRAQAMAEAEPTMDVWAGNITTSAPMMNFGNAKAASQTYNVGSLFTNSATAIPKG